MSPLQAYVAEKRYDDDTETELYYFLGMPYNRIDYCSFVSDEYYRIGESAPYYDWAEWMYSFTGDNSATIIVNYGMPDTAARIDWQKSFYIWNAGPLRHLKLEAGALPQVPRACEGYSYEKEVNLLKSTILPQNFENSMKDWKDYGEW